MPTLRDDLIPIVDSLRDEVVDQVAGLRLDTVVVRTRTWSGGEPGRGDATNSDLTLTPRPKVTDPEPQKVAAEPGKYQRGDRIVEKISAAMTRAELGERPLSQGVEVVWLINGDEYILVGLDEQFLQRVAHVTRRRR